MLFLKRLDPSGHADGRDEVLVGLSAGSRKMGEALFERMNGA